MTYTVVIHMPDATGPVRRTPTQQPASHITPTHQPTSPTTTDCVGRLMVSHQQTAPPQQHRLHSPSTPAWGPPRPPTPQPSPQQQTPPSQSQGQVPIMEQNFPPRSVLHPLDPSNSASLTVTMSVSVNCPMTATPRGYTSTLQL